MGCAAAWLLALSPRRVVTGTVSGARARCLERVELRSQLAADTSLGARQSPRGESEPPEPTFGRSAAPSA